MQLPDFLIENFVWELVSTIIGVLLTRPILNFYHEKRYGGWTLTLVDKDKTLGRDTTIIENKEISTGKMRQIRETPEELQVYLKGICSPFHRVQCDIEDYKLVINEPFSFWSLFLRTKSDTGKNITRDNAFVIEDREKRLYIINIANDQKPENNNPLPPVF